MGTVGRYTITGTRELEMNKVDACLQYIVLAYIRVESPNTRNRGEIVKVLTKVWMGTKGWTAA